MIFAKMWPFFQIPETKYVLPKEPRVKTSSWVVGHACMLYHGMDWIYLQEFWQENPCVLYMN